MDLKPRQVGNNLVLSLEGKINHGASEELRENLLALIESSEAHYTRVVLDLSAVDHMSSVGLRVLMVAAKSAKRREKKIVVASLNETMQEIFQISRFHLLYEVFDSLEAALAAD